MIHSVRFTCVLDTNVIYPVWTRDILLWFAHHDLYTPKWSDHIFDEWVEVMKRKGVTNDQIKQRTQMVNQAFPDALVENYHQLIDKLELPDEKDRHVLAAAVKINANLIVTNNLKDFPREVIGRYGLSAKSPDDFLTDIIDLNHEISVKSFREMVMRKKNPPYTELEVLDILRNVGLADTANYLHTII